MSRVEYGRKLVSSEVLDFLASTLGPIYIDGELSSRDYDREVRLIVANADGTPKNALKQLLEMVPDSINNCVKDIPLFVPQDLGGQFDPEQREFILNRINEEDLERRRTYNRQRLSGFRRLLDSNTPLL